MKKVLIACLMVAFGFAAAWSQNANRKGFFLEGSIGGTTGTTPRVAVSFDNNTLLAHQAGGAAVSFGLGERYPISNYAAFEWAIEAMAPTGYISTSPVVRAHILGFRFYTNDFFGNMSGYFNFRLGVAGASKGEMSDIDPRNGEKIDLKVGDSGFTGGVAYSIGAGVNITTHFYAGFVWDAQYMFKQIRVRKPENLHWGMAALRLGYRF